MQELPPRLAPRSAVRTTQKIPRRIFQTFEARLVPARMYSATASWRDRNPEYEYVFHDDDTQRAFIDEHFGSELVRCYERLPRGAFQADLWRYCALYAYGGVYADIDTICTRSLGKLLQANDEFVVAHDKHKTCLFNAFICCSTKHPFLEAALDYAQREILGSDFAQRIAAKPDLPYWVVGPGGLAAAVNSVLGRPLGSPFSVGRYELSGLSFRILRKVHRNPLYLRRVMDGLRTVIMCKYSGYQEDLHAAGGLHWASTARSGAFVDRV